MIFYSLTNKLQFNKKGFELCLVSKVRVFWNSEMTNCVLTERVERVVVLSKLDFEWRTGTVTNPLPQNRRKLGSVQESCVTTCAKHRPPRITGLKISARKLAKSEWFSEVASQKKILWQKLESEHFSSGNLREKIIVVEEFCSFCG